MAATVSARVREGESSAWRAVSAVLPHPFGNVQTAPVAEGVNCSSAKTVTGRRHGQRGWRNTHGYLPKIDPLEPAPPGCSSDPRCSPPFFLGGVLAKKGRVGPGQSRWPGPRRISS